MTSKQDGQDLREKLSLWESSLATLSDRQKDGVMTLSTVANSRPIPKDVSVRHSEVVRNKCVSVRDSLVR